MSCEKCNDSGRYTYTLPRPPGENDVFTSYCDLCPQGKFAENEDFPPKYPKCTADPPHSPDDLCGYENCDLHNILWLEKDGCTHEQAIGLTAVYGYSESMGYGPVADALGGMDEFNQLNEEGPDVPGMIAWYNAHLPLVYYILEIWEKDPEGLWNYWWQAKNPQHHVPVYEEFHLMVVKRDDGQWQPYKLPSLPVVFPANDPGFTDVSKLDPTYTDTSYWQTHDWAVFRHEVNALHRI